MFGNHAYRFVHVFAAGKFRHIHSRVGYFETPFIPDEQLLHESL